MKKITALILVLALALSIVGCASQGIENSENDLMKDVQAKEPSGDPVSVSGVNAVSPTDFAVRLFQKALDANENTMISPVSVLYALAMTANGAKGDTLAEMEAVLGTSISDLNAYLKAYMDALPNGDKYKLSIANSIWLTNDERFTAKPNFLQTNADYYGAGIFQVPFNDATCRDINNWVKKNTDGMIKEILDEISPYAVMYLVNAMAFDAEWKDIYKDTQVCDGVFTTEDGDEQKVEMMHSEERYYLEDENATGFIKHYADSKYAFVALLPKEGMSVAEYIQTLTGEGIASMLANPRQTSVQATMPKFESEYSVEMSEILKAMGMQDAFDSQTADFTGLGTSTAGNIFISRVLHKTYIAVDERGTKAGAATVVEMADGAAMIEEVREVVLDRPFVYMIIDCEANLPLFIGTLMDAD